MSIRGARACVVAWSLAAISAAAHEPDHDAILRLYLGQDRRRTWHLPKNVATFETLVDPTAPLKDPTRSLFAHLAMRQISELTRAAAGTALGSGERRAIFGPLLQLVRHRLPGLVDEVACHVLDPVRKAACRCLRAGRFEVGR